MQPNSGSWKLEIFSAASLCKWTNSGLCRTHTHSHHRRHRPMYYRPMNLMVGPKVHQSILGGDVLAHFHRTSINRHGSLSAECSHWSMQPRWTSMAVPNWKAEMSVCSLQSYCVWMFVLRVFSFFVSSSLTSLDVSTAPECPCFSSSIYRFLTV